MENPIDESNYLTFQETPKKPRGACAEHTILQVESKINFDLLKTPNRLLLTNLKRANQRLLSKRKTNLPHAQANYRKNSTNRKNTEDKFNMGKSKEKNNLGTMNNLNSISENLEAIFELQNEPNSVKKILNFDEEPHNTEKTKDHPNNNQKKKVVNHKKKFSEERDQGNQVMEGNNIV